uniref:Sperm acrosome associated 7 n=1 Tax=Rhinolophus ferrumequinum TaxID=59479 RepID=A0A671EMV3_RHIFE
MAVNREVTLFVLLLCCWQEAELQPINMTSGPIAPTPKTQEDMRGVFDEILVQEILEPNKSSGAGPYRTAATLSTRLYAGIDENDQVGGPEGYHELSDNSQFSFGSEDGSVNNEPSADESYQVGDPEGYHESPLPSNRQDRISNNEKNSKNDIYENLSVLDKILQNIEKSSGNSFHKWKRRSEAQTRSRGGQY